MGSKYYDVESILAEEERVPLTMLTEAQGLGFLDATSTKPDLEDGSRVELPLWLVEAVAPRAWAQVELPKCYSHRFRTFLLADPTVINLRERSQVYYETGMELAAYVRDSRPLVDTLIKTLSMRYSGILNKAQNSRNQDISQTILTLTKLERDLFFAGHQGALEMYRFKRRDKEKVVNHRRKRVRV